MHVMPDINISIKYPNLIYSRKLNEKLNFDFLSETIKKPQKKIGKFSTEIQIILDISCFVILKFGCIISFVSN